MSKKDLMRWPQRILHIREEIDYLFEFLHTHTFEEFKNSKTLKYAAARSFQIMGEAVKKVPLEIKEKYPSLPWKNMAAFRDVIVHDYDDLDEQMMWQVLSEIIPTLKTDIQKIDLPEEL